MKHPLIERLGGKCADCGSTDRLQIDHVHGDGAKHRSLIRRRKGWGPSMVVKGQRFYDYVREHGDDGYALQVLCQPCHDRKNGRERAGRNPHTKRRGGTTPPLLDTIPADDTERLEVIEQATAYLYDLGATDEHGLTTLDDSATRGERQ